MYDFNYHRPKDLKEAVKLLKNADDGVPMSGGMTLIPTLKLRLARPSDLVDLAAIPSLRGITDAGDAIVFDNHRALHARSEFSDRRRYMQICGVTREKFHESFRLLAARLGDIESSNLVLRAGACR